MTLTIDKNNLEINLEDFTIDHIDQIFKEWDYIKNNYDQYIKTPSLIIHLPYDNWIEIWPEYRIDENYPDWRDVYIKYYIAITSWDQCQLSFQFFRDALDDSLFWYEEIKEELKPIISECDLTDFTDF